MSIKERKENKIFLSFYKMSNFISLYYSTFKIPNQPTVNKTVFLGVMTLKETFFLSLAFL